MFRHPLGLEWVTVGGEQGWRDPRVKGVIKLLPKNMGPKQSRKIYKEISQQQAKERHSKRWFVGDNTVKETSPDLTPVKNVGGKKGMRSLLQQRTKDLAWEKDWSQLNPNQIAELGGKGDRVTNKVAQELMKTDELAVQKALNTPLSKEIQGLNKLNELSQQKKSASGDSPKLQNDGDPLSLQNAAKVWGGRFPNMVTAANEQLRQQSDIKTQVDQQVQQRVNVEKRSDVAKIEDLTKRDRFALAQVRGSVAQNKARIKELQIEGAPGSVADQKPYQTPDDKNQDSKTERETGKPKQWKDMSNAEKVSVGSKAALDISKALFGDQTKIKTHSIQNRFLDHDWMLGSGYVG